MTTLCEKIDLEMQGPPEDRKLVRVTLGIHRYQDDPLMKALADGSASDDDWKKAHREARAVCACSRCISPRQAPISFGASTFVCELCDDRNPHVHCARCGSRKHTWCDD